MNVLPPMPVRQVSEHYHMGDAVPWLRRKPNRPGQNDGASAYAGRFIVPSRRPFSMDHVPKGYVSQAV